ncbi:coatomer subunit epsilon [Topomyia yanbarensis]|uniref:coatomer subunit epsilon n=1 Tax=Topomyia yanbarensis TaxID=2498891 RepID=UPI00273BD9BD|nr:coatomer subunit epsilon [Topomyia yanbarensis]
MSRHSNEVDELFDVKNSFYIGNYQHCINEAQKITKPSLEKDTFLYRAYIAQHKYRVVLDGIRSNSDNPLLALRYLAEYLSDKSRREVIVSLFDDKFKGDISELDVTWIIVGSIVYCYEGTYESALKILHGNFHLECLSLQLQCLLHMSRVDLAKQVLQTMQEKDDDATLTQLSQAWLNIQLGGEKLQDAFFIFQDFCDKFSPSLLLLNGQAVCYIGQQKYEDAENVLLECLNRDPNNYDTLINLLLLSQQKEKNNNQFNRYLSQVLDQHKDSALLATYNKKQAEFDRLVLQYGPSNNKSVEDIVA